MELTILHVYISLVKLIYKIYNDLASINMSQIIVKPRNKYNFRSTNKLVSRFNTYFMKHSIAHRGSIVWNAELQRTKIININKFVTICLSNLGSLLCYRN